MNNVEEEPLPKKAPGISIEQDTKIYIVPEEIANIRTRSFALQQLRDIYINMKTRNELLFHIESRITELNILSQLKSETQEEIDKRLKQDSSK